MDGHVLEVRVQNNFELDIEDIIGNIEGSRCFYHKNVVIPLTKMSFVAHMAMSSIVGLCSNHFVVVHNKEFLHQDIVPYLFDKAPKVFYEQHNKVVLFDLSQHPFGK